MSFSFLTLLNLRELDETVNVDRRPDVRPLFVLQFDPVRVPLVPQFDDLSRSPSLGSVGLDAVPELEAELIIALASRETVGEGLLVDVLPDEDEAALALRRAKRVAIEGSFVLLITAYNLAAATLRTEVSTMYVDIQYTRLLSHLLHLGG